MICVDDGVPVALTLNEPASAGVARWYPGARRMQVSTVWCVTKLASALRLGFKVICIRQIYVTVLVLENASGVCVRLAWGFGQQLTGVG